MIDRQHQTAALSIAMCEAALLLLVGCRGARSNAEINEDVETESLSDSRAEADGHTEGDADGGEVADSGEEAGESHCLDPVDTASDTVLTGDQETASDSDTMSDTAGSTGEGTEILPDTDTGTQSVHPTDTGNDIETASETEGGTDTHADTASSSETAIDTAVDTETDSIDPTPTDTVSDTGTGDISPTDTATNTDTETSTKVPASCPEEMVIIPANAKTGVATPFCIDRYEASRSDAAAESAGTDETIAVSQPGVIPWYVNPMSLTALVQFEAACVAAGKRLCRSDEWFASCTGPEATTYVFGNTFDAEVCNCVDTFCDDYCMAHAIPIETCDMDANCGYSCGAATDSAACYHVVPTGSFFGCTNELHTLDINGNVWEVVPSDTDARGYEVRGGAFNCASASARLACTYNAGWDDLYAGFRCCKDAVE